MPKGTKMSLESRKKMSESHKRRGTIPPPRWGISPWNKGIKMGVNPRHSAFMSGRKLSEETKKKLSLALKGRPHKPHSLETRKKISLVQIGKKLTPEQREKAIKNLKPDYWKGKKRPNFSGDKCPLWRGGVTKKNKLIRSSFEYKNWRTAVFERDGYTCKGCGKKGEYIQAHHIKSFSKHPELRLDLRNGITLCLKCHGEKHNISHLFDIRIINKRDVSQIT